MREDQLGEIIQSGIGPDGQHFTHRFPTYTCGHCSQVVVMRPDRARERKRCMKCMRLLCEQNELCRKDCTPIHALARDHFESEKHAPLAGAILAGCTTEEEARRRGFKI